MAPTEDYPADYPQAPRGSSLDIVFRAMHEHGFEFGDGQDWQCPVHDDEIPSCGIMPGESKAVIVSCQKCIQRLESSALFKQSFASALGLDDDLFDHDPDGAPRSKLLSEGERQKIGATRKARARVGTVEAEYVYTREDGSPAMKVERLVDVETGKKFFRQWSATPEGWRLGLREGVERPLYQLPFVREAIESDGEPWVIHFVEGEKSVEALGAQGLIATTLAGGSNVKDAVVSDAIRGLAGARFVKIIADNDESGYRFALRVYHAIKALDSSIKVNIVRSATSGKGDDAVEHFATHSYEELVRLSTAEAGKLAGGDAGSPQAGNEPRANDPVVISPRTDDDEDAADDPNHWPGPDSPHEVATVFVTRRYREGMDRTLHYWNETFYQWDRVLNRYRERDMAGMRAEVYDVLSTARFWKSYADKPGMWLNWSPDMGKVTQILDALKAVCYLDLDYAEGSWLDGSEGSGYVHFTNGHLDVSAGNFVDPSPRMFNHNSLPFPFDPDAPYPTEWVRFLRSVWPGKSERRLLQEWFGYVLSGDTYMQKMLLMVGPTRSGKGTIKTVLESLMGSESCASSTLQGLAGNFGLQPLLGKSLNTIGDARFGGRADQMKAIVERLLTITGEDAITVDRKNKTAWFGVLPTRLMILSNEVPRLIESSDALATRFLILEMTRSWKDHEDHDLKRKLAAEYPGIIRWALVGLKRLREQGHFTRVSSGDAIRADLLVLGNPMRAFVSERLRFETTDKNGDATTVERKAVYDEYRMWANENGIAPLSSIAFGRELKSAFGQQYEAIQIRHGRVRVEGYRGIVIQK